MFVQVLKGRTSKGAELRAATERWRAELAPGATGWLGTTAGVADDGTFVALVRFESEEAARANSDRPEQGAWWAETSALFDGDMTFRDCVDVDIFGNGGSDDAGFVQVMEGRSTDVEATRKLGVEMDATMADFRPDVIGGVNAWHAGGAFTSAVFFTSEADARANENKEPPPEAAELMARDLALYEGGLTFIDLRDPWLSSPSR